MLDRSPPTDREALLTWAEACGLADRLARPAATLVPHLAPAFGQLLGLWGHALTVADLAVDERWTRSTLGAHLPPAGVASLQEAVRGWLAAEARRLERVLAAEAELDGVPVPAHPVLAQLRRGLDEARAALRATAVPRARDELELPRVHLDLDVPALVYAEGTGAAAVRVVLPLASWDVEPLAPACHRCGGAPCAHALSAVDAFRLRLAALDPAPASPADDDPEAPAPAAPLIRVLAAPAWDRVLQALDREAAEPEAPRAPAEPVRWTVRLRPEGLSLSPSRPLSDIVLHGRPQDRRAADLLLAADDADTALDARTRAHLALGHLVGHPAVRLDGGEALTVREGRLSLVATARPGGAFALLPALDDAVVELEALFERLEREAPGGLLADLDRPARTLTVYELTAEQRRVLQLLHRHGHLFPAESHAALLARVPALQAVMPVRLPSSVRGEEMRADPTPLLRLHPVGDAALRLEVLVRPVPGGPSFVPGTGAAEVHGFFGAQRVFAGRDHAEERRRAREVLGGLPLDPDTEDAPFRFFISRGEAALALVQHLEQVGDDPGFKVEWPQGAAVWRVRTARAGGLRVSVQGRRDWFGLGGGIDLDGEEVQLALLLDAVRRGERYVHVRGGLWVAIAEDLRERLRALAEHVDEKGGVNLAGAAALEEFLEEAGEVDAGETWQGLSRRIREARRAEAEVPGGLNATLRPYQLEGFRWMVRLAAWGGGGVLADDMGLGKTLQTITLLLHRAETGPALVVAPTSVGPNWLRELGRFAPGLRARLYVAERDREAVLAELGPGDVLVVSYGLLSREAERFAARRFGTLVLDEAQAVKNPASGRSRACRELDADFRLALTGTPVENHLGELWSLFAIVMPGLLGPLARFRDKFINPIERTGSWARREALSKVVRPFILRRTKREVLHELPPKVEVDVSVRLSSAERRLYEEARLAALARVAAPSAGAGATDEQRRFEILSAITRLRLLACNPRLADERSQVASSKLARFLEIVDELRSEGHRALVFSQFTRHLKIVREALDARGVDYLYLDGGTSALGRGELVEAFQRGRGDLFLVSLKAGGTGLNLTAADHVIHLDPWWNPALEDQATDRAHRMGQQRSVTVLRMVAGGTIEELILELHRHKRGLLEGILDGGDAAARLGVDELQSLLAEGQAIVADDDEDGERDEAAAALEAQADAILVDAGHGELVEAAAPPRAESARAARVIAQAANAVSGRPAARTHKAARAQAPRRVTAEAARPRPAVGPTATPPPRPPAEGGGFPRALGGSPGAFEALLGRFEQALQAEGASGARTYPRALRRFGAWVRAEAGRLPADAEMGTLSRRYLDALSRGLNGAAPDEPIVARPALARLDAFLRARR